MAPYPLPAGLRATVTVPASSANLGPGFDTLGLALGLYDDVTAETVEGPAGGLTVTVEGEGAGAVPTDERHLVVVALRRTLAHLGVAVPSLNLKCVNRIPHSRGLGSSAAAAVAGIAAAAALAKEGGAPRGLTVDEMVQLASEFEGHPDNASASVLGGAVVAWTVPAAPVPDSAGYRDQSLGHGQAPSGPTRYDARRVDVHPDIRAYVFVPDVESSTSVTRGMLPRLVPHADAAFNASRAALMVLALTAHPDLLLDATEDRLHQRYRAASMKASFALVERLRANRVAAAISGAGPTVLALTPEPLPAALAAAAEEAGFTVRELPIADGVSRS